MLFSRTHAGKVCWTLQVPGSRSFAFPNAGKVFRSLECDILHSPMPENSCPWRQARSPCRGQTSMAWRNVKCLIPGTGRLFRHLGMQKVSFQGPEEFSDMGECKKDPWVAGKMSLYQQWDCQSFVKEFSDGTLIWYAAHTKNDAINSGRVVDIELR